MPSRTLILGIGERSGIMAVFSLNTILNGLKIQVNIRIIIIIKVERPIIIFIFGNYPYMCSIFTNSIIL